MEVMTKTTWYPHVAEGEVDRLFRQAQFLEQSIYGFIDLASSHKLLEVGCGAGAQTSILLERFPALHICGVDVQQKQVNEATKRLAPQIKAGRASYHKADARRLPFDHDSFDSAFLCWFLEHVQSPLDVLREIKRVLVPGSVIFCTEVLNSSFFVHPASTAVTEYWNAFNENQTEGGGDPNIGAKLGNLLQTAGFCNIITRLGDHFYDSRDEATAARRAEMCRYWKDLLMSAVPQLEERKMVSEQTTRAMQEDLTSIGQHTEGVFFYSFIQARAYV